VKLGGKKNNKGAVFLASVKLGAKKNNKKHEEWCPSFGEAGSKKKYKQKQEEWHPSFTEAGTQKIQTRKITTFQLDRRWEQRKNTNKKKDDIPTSPKLGGNKRITQKKKDNIPVSVRLEEKQNEEEERRHPCFTKAGRKKNTNKNALPASPMLDHRHENKKTNNNDAVWASSKLEQKVLHHVLQLKSQS
jgi:hypothetical protein